MRLLMLLTMCMFATAAHAQLRAIPGEAKAGEMRHVHDMIVAVNGVELRLAPGAQIRDAANRLVLPSALPAGAQVRYVLDTDGLVRQVWVLSPGEAAKAQAVNTGR